MSRRYNGNMNGEQYLGNMNEMEVHDLDNETGNFQIDKIIDAGNDRPYRTVQTAHDDGHDNCHYCIGGSTR